jgi:carbonic anhydrase
MQQLLKGIRIFQQRVFPACRRQFEQLAAGQQPSTLLITCSDSRIVPDLLTQTGPGELFVLRNAGNLVPPYGEPRPSGEAATIEYAVNVLGVSEIIVCGHTHCGAISGLLDPQSTATLPAVRLWLSHARQTLEELAADDNQPASADRLTRAVAHNVRVQLDHLRTYPYVAVRESSGELTLRGWLYRFESGDVFELETQTGQFASVAANTTNEIAVV